MKTLTGQLALVTGGGRGLGAAIARALAEQGAHVIVADTLGESAAQTAAALCTDGFTAWGETLDVAKRDEVNVFAEHVAKR
jgi:NAD(P)-dependent dehydrogenase (short-subunit alcohol dehydrogenase family)